jgi:hypothetical protein
MDEFRDTAHMTELPWQPVGRVWPWLVAAIGALIIVAGAVLFSPDAVFTSAAPTPTWFG